MSPEMKSTLDILCKEINKKYGADTIIQTNETPLLSEEDILSTGSIKINTALGIGGLPRGRVIEILGAESSGKSTQCLHLIAEAQSKGLKCLYVDMEHAYDARYAESLGVNTSELYFVQPDFGEAAIDIILMFAKSGEVGLIVLDSAAALVPQKELEGEINDSSVGTQARLMSKAMRMLVPICGKTKTTLVVTNQYRQKIAVMYGDPNVGTCGNALKYYSSIRLTFARIGDVKDGKDGIVGNVTKVKVIKNKMSAPKKDVELEIIFGKGFNQIGELIDLAVEDGIISKSGAWYKYEDNNVAQGLSNCTNWLNENPEIKEKIRLEILSNRGME